MKFTFNEKKFEDPYNAKLEDFKTGVYYIIEWEFNYNTKKYIAIKDDLKLKVLGDQCITEYDNNANIHCRIISEVLEIAVSGYDGLC